MNEKVSILIPVFNGSAFLESCLTSVFQQTHSNFEVLVSDDGSSDQSARLVQSFADPRLKLFHGPRQGLFANLNFLLSQSTGTFVRILCQDDRMHARCLEREILFHQKHPLVSISFCKANRMDGEGRLLSQPNLSDLPDILSPDLSQQHFFYHGCIAGNLSTVFFRRSLVERYGKFDTSYVVSGDYEFWSRLCENEYLGILQESLVDLRVHETQLSRKTSSLIYFVQENRKIRGAIFSRLPDSVKERARQFEQMRHDVMDFHSGLRSFIDGKTMVGLSVLWSFAPLRLFSAGIHWAWTANNHWFRPQAPWVLGCDWPKEKTGLGLPSRRVAA